MRLTFQSLLHHELGTRSSKQLCYCIDRQTCSPMHCLPDNTKLSEFDLFLTRKKKQCKWTILWQGEFKSTYIYIIEALLSRMFDGSQWNILIKKIVFDYFKTSTHVAYELLFYYWSPLSAKTTSSSGSIPGGDLPVGPTGPEVSLRLARWHGTAGFRWIGTSQVAQQQRDNFSLITEWVT